ncbi:MAG: TerC family protein [Gammaproteobacteria bacterium]|jgi:predicted tellurium resistance membrane protein TerC|nr:TerC family protein [Gammaproteobacteria bacterium]
MNWITDPQAWMALFTLTALEIVLGIDNIIILTILVGRLPKKDRQLGRVLGLGLAMGTRIVLLLSIVWIMQLVKPLFTIFNFEISGRDIILILGGLFLIAKSTHEIHQSLEGGGSDAETFKVKGHPKFLSVIIQIALIDIVFSLDSVITAVGLANQVSIMVIAIVIAVLVMMFAAKAIGDFVDEHPTIKMLALSFLILIGVVLIGDGLDMHVPKSYIYFAMAYTVLVEMLNLKVRKKMK